MFVGTVASAKVDVQVGVGVKPAKPAQNVTAFYANKCVKSVKQAIAYNGGQVTYTEIEYANGNESAVYAEYITQKCFGYGYSKICQPVSQSKTFGCYKGQI